MTLHEHWFMTHKPDPKNGMYVCRMCGQYTKPEDVELDFDVPLSEGGTKTLDNLQCLCARCNMIKSGRSGFELVELLVAFILTAIIAALLISVAKSAIVAKPTAVDMNAVTNALSAIWGAMCAVYTHVSSIARILGGAILIALAIPNTRVALFNLTGIWAKNKEEQN